MTRAVSVVIPTHDRDVLLPRAIESALLQGSAVCEVVVVDDLDRAGTRTVVARFADRNVPVRHVDASALQHKGPSASRNLGARCATGDTLAFLDDDDRWLAGYLDRALAELDRGDRCCVVTWTYRVRDGQRHPGSRLDAEVDHRDPAHRYWAFGVTGSNLVVDAATFDLVGGYDEQLWSREDYEIFVRLLEDGRGYGLVTDALVEQDANGDGHLAGKSLRAAAGVPHYLSRHGARMDRRQRRGALRHFHAMSSGPDNRRARRVYHRVMQAWYSSARDWRMMTVGRITGDRPPRLR